MAKKYQAPRGTEDVTPADAPKWRLVESSFASLVALYGYEEIRTPMFEDFELFVRSSGETSEVVSKQMYDFMDKGDRHIALKPEETAPAMRAYIEHGLGQPGQTTRLWYCTPVFRYERPQKGRLRQPHQVGLELIGSASPAADAEVIEVTVKFYERLGIGGVSVLLNCIGRGDSREKYCAALLTFVASWLMEQNEEYRAKAQKNPLRLLDTKDEELKSALKGAPSILDFIGDESRAHFEAVQGLLTDAGVRYEVRPDVVRGLDYYTDTVFEVQSEGLGSQNALCGGGRYDWLIQELGGPDTPSVGVAMGIERAIMVMESHGTAIPKGQPPVFLVAATDGARSEVAKLARELRDNGIAALLDLEARALKAQMKQADRSGARLALILGDDEIANGTVTVKNLKDGEQHIVARSAIIGELQ